MSARPWRNWHLISPREPRLDVCSHGRPDHQLMLRQLGEALGYDLPALNATPEQVWAGLLDEVERRSRNWAPPSGPRVAGVPPWQGGRLLERAT